MINEIKDYDLSQLEGLAKNLATNLIVGDIICLQGDLGAGKTTFAGYLINSLLPEKQNVTSPTFNLVQTYDTYLFTIWHFDLYRLKEENEVYNLGIEDAFKEGVAIIEWPEIIMHIIPQHAYVIRLSFSDNDNKRQISQQKIINQIIK